jgi:hypothetical protein
LQVVVPLRVVISNQNNNNRRGTDESRWPKSIKEVTPKACPKQASLLMKISLIPPSHYWSCRKIELHIQSLTGGPHDAMLTETFQPDVADEDSSWAQVGTSPSGDEANVMLQGVAPYRFIS